MFKAAAILLKEFSGFGRRCRRQRRATVAAVAAVVDTPSSIPIDDGGEECCDLNRYFVFVNVFTCSLTV
ncbi:hypothetical protein Y032_0264g612 [Ancylostoma ceylanicum]|uniref:Uncharacterized protein n=1 Tax=Ancylostoma ceylanicum TaxID=53326 RepID=A0A016SAG3_9BILA|nr:hypothetical protein Y032_0264g612 [Ancylostoma ceylanicum]